MNTVSLMPILMLAWILFSIILIPISAYFLVRFFLLYYVSLLKEATIKKQLKSPVIKFLIVPHKGLPTFIGLFLLGVILYIVYFDSTPGNDTVLLLQKFFLMGLAPVFIIVGSPLIYLIYVIKRGYLRSLIKRGVVPVSRIAYFKVYSYKKAGLTGLFSFCFFIISMILIHNIYRDYNKTVGIKQSVAYQFPVIPGFEQITEQQVNLYPLFQKRVPAVNNLVAVYVPASQLQQPDEHLWENYIQLSTPKKTSIVYIDSDDWQRTRTQLINSYLHRLAIQNQRFKNYILKVTYEDDRVIGVLEKLNDRYINGHLQPTLRYTAQMLYQGRIVYFQIFKEYQNNDDIQWMQDTADKAIADMYQGGQS